MTDFYNPYQFVGVEKTTDAVKKAFWTDRKTLARDADLHSRYAENKHSGRIIARLRTVTPVAIGAHQESKKKSYAKVEPYQPGGRAAIPASSLRGMIGSLIETASNAPLRVLTDRAFSYRRKMEESLSAIGLIEKEGEGATAKYWLKPMCLPTLESADGGRTFKAPPGFKALFPKGPQFKVYFGTRDEITNPAFPYRTALSAAQAVSMPVKQLSWNGEKVNSDRTLHVKANRYAVSQIADPRDSPKRGVVRVLGCWPQERARDIPYSKKHELWIPLPAEGGKRLLISREVIERFEQLADERTDTDERLPFEPLDTRPHRREDKEFRLRLETGDMVYFNVNNSGDVTEVSFSSIWRGRVEDRHGKAATTHTFFGGIDPDILPIHPKRERVSIAEKMLGFVDEIPKEQRKFRQGAMQLASRLQFADANALESEKNLLDAAVTLKILSSPKPPCPVLYFRKKGDGGYIQKRALNATDHEPNGRKVYLHARSEGLDAPWRTRVRESEDKSKDQKNTVTPLRRGLDMFFHIDFHNLSDDELGLLLYALEPAPGFHLKIGMGKPLGLGSVKIDVMGLFPIDRRERYSLQGLRGERYQPCWLSPAGREAREKPGAWPQRYVNEKKVVASEDANTMERYRTRVRQGIVTDSVHRQLEIVGDWANAPEASLVRYPTTVDQRDHESEHFKWFVFNDGQRERGQGMSPKEQYLSPLRGEKRLPTLSAMEWDGAPRRR